MKLIARLTLRALKENRRRTMATMLAIIIATAMLCSITTLAASAINGMKQREIDTSGYWHTEYVGVPGDQVSRICEDEGSAACAVTQGVGYALLCLFRLLDPASSSACRSWRNPGHRSVRPRG